jgi:hypothetical protein
VIFVEDLGDGKDIAGADSQTTRIIPEHVKPWEYPKVLSKNDIEIGWSERE